MSVKTAQAVTVEFCTANPATAAAQNGDALPTGILYVDGTADGATVTVTNITTGAYKAAVTLPALTAGQIVALRISAVVEGRPGTDIVWQDSADTYRTSDVYTVVDDIGGDLGEPVLATLSADIAAIKAETADIIVDTGTTLDAALTLVLKLLRNKVTTNPTTGVMTIYADNGSDVLYTANVYEDVAGSVPFDGSGANRRDRLA
jgi:hypothetical protein